MKQARLYAGLTGLLVYESQRRLLPAGQANTLARELWYSAMGAEAPPVTKDGTPLPVLDKPGLEELQILASEHASAAMLAMLFSDYHSASSSDTAHAAPISQKEFLQELLIETASKLSVLHDKPEETADGTVRALWQMAAGAPMSVELATETPLPLLDDAAMVRLRELIRQRLAGMPLAHLTGRQRFMGLELLISKAALVPRKETELLGTAALAVLRQLAVEQKSPTVIDVCTGAGNLALALASLEPAAKIFASDLSADAVDLARSNSRFTGLANRVEFRQGDFLNPFADGQFDRTVDLLVCNPPYISSGKVVTLPSEIIGHEPSLAFDGGPFGVKILQRLLTEAAQFLRPGGWLAFEVGLGQGPALMERMRRNPVFADLAAVADVTGAVRAVVARVQ